MAHIDFQNARLIYPAIGFKGAGLKDFLLGRYFRQEKKGDGHFTALTDVSFRINEGERVGIIGDNGAGKSTLLRAIAGVFPLASGWRDVQGSLCSLFDILAGMGPESTGYENIRMRCLLHGDRPWQIDAKIPGIANFCELGEFLKMPIRCYSTGMTIRLAFAIASSREPEILLIDEVFVNGDLAFQRKCEQRLCAMLSSARIVVMVGHHLDFLRRFASRVIWLERGAIRADGPAVQVIDRYVQATLGARQAA